MVAGCRPSPAVRIHVRYTVENLTAHFYQMIFRHLEKPPEFERIQRLTRAFVQFAIGVERIIELIASLCFPIVEFAE